MTTNFISGALAPQDLEQILANLADIRKKMPFMLEMAGKTKRALPKMGDKSRAFVHKAMDVAAQHEDYLPRSFDLEEMRRDLALFEAIYTITMEVNQLQSELDDTLTAVGSDAYSAALQVYRHVKAHGQGSGLDVLVQDMGQRFGRKARQEKGLD
jgi:hypothetical protein